MFTAADVETFELAVTAISVRSWPARLANWKGEVTYVTSDQQTMFTVSRNAKHRWAWAVNNYVNNDETFASALISLANKDLSERTQGAHP